MPKGFAIWIFAVGMTFVVVAAVNSRQSGGQLALEALKEDSRCIVTEHHSRSHSHKSMIVN